MVLKKFKNRKRKGFTLIEMVIVITIIGILSSIAVGKYSKVQENAKLNADYATASNLATAAMLSLNDGNSQADTQNLSKLKSNGYIEYIPTPKSQRNQSFAIEVGANDSITVKVNGNILYPRNDNTTSQTPSTPTTQG